MLHSLDRQISHEDITASEKLDTHMVSAIFDAYFSNMDTIQDFVKAECRSCLSTSLVCEPNHFFECKEDPIVLY